MTPAYKEKHLPPPDQTPWISGPAGQVWKMDVDGVRKLAGTTADDDGTVGCWFIHCPGAHPFWYGYFFLLIHLRPLKDQRPTKIHLEGATHEVMLWAVHPDWKCDLSDPKFMNHRLEPINFAAQFRAGTDQEALRYCLRALTDVANGGLNPDTDFRRQWVERFGDNMLKK